MNLEFEKIKMMIEKNGGLLNKPIVQELMEQHQSFRAQYAKDFERYKTTDLPIKNRTFEDETKINNKVNNDFAGEIVDQTVGYLFGTPINYNLDKTKYAEDAKYEKHKELLERFNLLNQIKDLDAETGKRQAINGITYRLCYVDKEGQERVKHVPPEEVILLGDLEDPDYGIWYYQAINENIEKVTRIEFYTPEKVIIYDDLDGVLTVHDELTNVFGYVPIVAFKNNDELQNDFEKVEELIDAYDRLISDGVNESEEFRQAYMVFTNATLGDTDDEEKETIAAARRNGAFALPLDSDLKFLTKTIDTSFLEFMKKTLSENIYRFSKSIDMSAENFSGGGESGESRKYKLISLENKASMKERKFNSGLNRMFKVLAGAWNKKGFDIDYLYINFDFKRTLPIDYLYYAQVISQLDPFLSRKSLFGELPFVDDPEYEIEQKRQEQEEMAANSPFNGFRDLLEDEEEEEDPDDGED